MGRLLTLFILVIEHLAKIIASSLLYKVLAVQTRAI
jgi:hypothetical protein